MTSFKPCYKWITFNTFNPLPKDTSNFGVLNLVINGLPSILSSSSSIESTLDVCFKPCYKWITFNTIKHKTVYNSLYAVLVLNLVINGLPSIPLLKV